MRFTKTQMRCVHLVVWSKQCVMSESKCLIVFLEGIHNSALICSGIKRMMDGCLTNADKITTYNFLKETYYATRLLINEITKTSAKTSTKNQEKLDDSKVNNPCSVAMPNEMEQKGIIWTLLLRIKEQIRMTMMTS